MKWIICPLGAILMAGGILQAQAPSIRKDVWLGLGFGVGQVHTSCDSCGSGADLASHYVFRTGITLSPNLLLGVEWDKVTSQRNSNGVSGIHLTAYFYPARRGNLFLKAGVGKASYNSNTPHSPDVKGSGIGVMGGLGFDLRASESISVMPMLTMMYGKLKVGTDVRETSYAFSIGLTFH